MIKNVSLIIWGVVQGVNFRYFIKRKASELNIKGFVQNNPEGAVLVEAEGEKEVLKNFIDICEKGPSAAKIERIDILWQDKIKGYKEFSVRK